MNPRGQDGSAHPQRTPGDGQPQEVAAGINDLATIQPKFAAVWFRNLHQPDEVIATSTKKYYRKCIRGQQTNQPPRSRSIGSGCTECPTEDRALNRP